MAGADAVSTQELAASIASVKVDADKRWNYDDALAALQLYVGSMRQTDLPEAVIPRVVDALTNADPTVACSPGEALALAAIGVMLDPAFTAGEEKLRSAVADLGPEAAIQNVFAALPSLSSGALGKQIRGEVVPAIAGSAASNLANCCAGLRLWPQVLVAAAAACLMNPTLAEKNMARFATAAAHLGVRVASGSTASAASSVLDGVLREPTLAKLLNTIEQERQGSYEWAAFAAGGETAVPTAEFFAPVRVGVSPNRGCGLFADTAFAAGDVILCEYPTGYATVGSSSNASEALRVWLLTAARLPFMGHVMQRTVDTYDGNNRVEGNADGRFSNAPFASQLACNPLAFDTLPAVPQPSDAHLERAIALNAYTGEHFAKRVPSSAAALGLYPTAGMINHDAEYNAIHYHVWRFLVVRARRPIAKGEEITTTYVNSSVYLREAQPLQPWDVKLERDEAARRVVAAAYDSFGAQLDKLAQYESGAALLPRLEAPCTAAYVAAAGLFAAAAKNGGPSHPAFVALLDVLRNPSLLDLSVLEQCVRVPIVLKKTFSKDAIAAMAPLLERWSEIALGHSELAVFQRTG